MRINIWNTTKAVLAVGAMLFTACQPDEYELGDLLKKEELKYSITQDASDPNAIVLQAQNPGHQPFWITPMGRSTLAQDTVRIPFEGEYSFVYGVISAGGVVQADTFKLNLTTTNLNYVNDPLWTLLSGGVGKEKTWIWDNGSYGLAPGPLSYADPSVDQEFQNYSANWDPGNMPPGSTDENMGWNSTMTFSLKNGAFFSAVKYNEGGTEESPKLESGTYFLNVNSKTLDIVDANLLRPDNYIENASNWNTAIKVLELTENQLRVAIMRTNDEGPWYYILSYVSKDYADNYDPGDVPDPEPQLPADWKEEVSQVVSTTITWKLSTKNPLDWAYLDGSRMNGWNAPEDYPDWLGTPDPSVYEGFSLVMNSADGSVVYTAPDGTQETGSYSLDEKGIYTFEGIAPSFSVIGWASFGLTAENQLRILSIEKDVLGNLSGMWVGAKDPVKPEYFAYHLVPSMGGGSDAVDPAEAIEKILTSKTWKLDSERSYDEAVSWSDTDRLQGPVIFSDMASWAWNPLPGEQYGAGEVGVDYGTMVFNADGTVVVTQRVRTYTYEEEGETVNREGLPEEGDVLASEEVETLNGTWAFDFERMSLTLSIGMLHPWTADYAVADWGEIQVVKAENNVLFLSVLRSAELSGEDEFPILYVFVPAAE